MKRTTSHALAALLTLLSFLLPAFAAEPIRTRAVAIDRPALFGAGATNAKHANTAVDAKHVPTTVRVPFFDDLAVDVQITGIARTASGGIALTGRVAGDPYSSAVLVDNDGVLSVMVSSQTLRLGVRGSLQSGYLASQFSPDGHDDVSHDDSVTIPADALAKATELAKAATLAKATPESVTSVADDGSLIDIMILYTPAARVLRGGAAQIEADIDAQVAFANLVFENSNVIPRLRLVHKGEIAFTEGNLFSDLPYLNNVSNIANLNSTVLRIAALRNAYKADLVSVWGSPWSDRCGVAYRPATETVGASIFGTFLVRAACTGPGNITFVHELGHTLGLQHDIYVEPNVRTFLSPEGQPPTNLVEVNYARGYVDTTNRFLTLMAYPDKCVDLGITCNTIPFFADPAATHDNSAFHATAVPAPRGHAVNGDDHRAINDTRDSIANYFLSSEVPPGGQLVIAQAYPKVSESAGSITLTVERLGGSAGSVTVTYNTGVAWTVAGSGVNATAGADYTTTTGVLSWPAGDNTSRSIVIPILNDTTLEGPEDFRVWLSNATGGADASGPGSGIYVQIIDDDVDNVFPPAGAIPNDWVTPGASAGAWTVDTTRGYLSSASLRSAAVVNAVSDLSVTRNFAAGNVTFAVQLDGPLDESRFELLLDGEAIYTLQPGSPTAWETVTRAITAGTHTLTWRYVHTGALPCSCAGRAWIDVVTLPATSATATASYLAFVPNSADGTVSVIRLLDNAVIETIPVGVNPTGVARHPNNNLMYVTNTGSASVSVIDTRALRVVRTITVPANPIGITVHASGNIAWITHADSNVLTGLNTGIGGLDAVFVSRTLPRTGAAGIDVNGLSNLYIAHPATGEVTVHNISTGESAVVPARAGAFGLALTNDSGQAWIAAPGEASAAVLAVISNSVNFTVPIAGTPRGVAMHPTAERVFVTTGTGNQLATITMPSGPVQYTNVGTNPYGVAVHPEGIRTYVINEGSNSVSVVNRSREVFQTVPVGNAPRGLGDFIGSPTLPAPPRNIVAVPGPSRATFTWTAGHFDGGSPITAHAIQCSPGGYNLGPAAPAMSYTINGMTNGTTYTCTMRALTARGLSPASLPFTVTPGSGVSITSAASATFPVLSAGSFTVTASGTIESYSYTGTLPSGVTLSSAGVLSGTPAAGTVGSYPITITAYSPTPVATQIFTLTVSKAAQAITFNALPARAITDPAFTLSAMGGGSGNPVTFGSTTLATCTTGGTNGATVTLVGTGTCTIDANQASDANHNAAPQVTRSFSIGAAQVITLGPAPSISVGTSATVSATGGASGNPVTFSSGTLSTCTVNGSIVTGVGGGACTIIASQAGNATYGPATASWTVTVGKATQAITFGTWPVRIGQLENRIDSSGASGQPVVITSLTPAICAGEGNKIRALNYGTCTVRANQAGNDNYQAAEATTSLLAISYLSSKRYGHAAVRLNDGRVLLAGGISEPTAFPVPTAEIYDPATFQWTPTGSMNVARTYHKLFLASDGRVVAIGGQTSQYQEHQTSSVEFFDPATGIWTLASAPSQLRPHAAVTQLADGRLLATGGVGAISSPAVSLFDPSTGQWTERAPMLSGRTHHSTALLQDGRVLVAGGYANAYSNPRAEAEIYDPVNNTWTSAERLPTAQTDRGAARLGDGRVLLAGGSYAVPYVYDPANNTWIHPMGGDWSLDVSITALPSGTALMIYENRTYTYNLATNEILPSTPMLFQHRGHTATLLANGSVIAAGGYITAPAYSHHHQFVTAYWADFTLQDGIAVGRVGQPYNSTLAVVGGAAPFAFAVTTGTLPAGITLDPVTGLLSGTPTANGTTPVTITVTDNTGKVTSRAYNFIVTFPPVTVTPTQNNNHGLVSPGAAIQVIPGVAVTFSVTPHTGYTASVGGTCGGTLAGTTYTTNTISTACSVDVTFTQVWFPPSPPIDLVATPIVGGATLTWTPGAANGSPIARYDVECYHTQGGFMQASTTTNSVTMMGTSTFYYMHCVARGVNVMGPGAWSERSNQFLALPVPTALTVQLEGDTAALAAARVTSAGIDCGGGQTDCTEPMLPGTQYTLTATTSSPSVYFSGWGGPGTLCVNKRNDMPTCTRTMDAVGQTVKAHFTTTPVAPGAPLALGATSRPGAALVDFYSGLSGGSPILQFTATCAPAVGGASVSAQSPTTPILVPGLTPGAAHLCSVTATNSVGTGEPSLVASVTPGAAGLLLTVTKAGTGFGTVQTEPNVSLINCGTHCRTTFDTGTTVTLSATPVAGSTFAGWSGGTGSAAGCTGTGTCVMTMNANSSVVATFNVNLTVTPSASSNGTISPSTPQTVAFGNTTTFTVTPNAGYVASVGGTCGGNLVGTMYTTAIITVDCTVIASFTAAGFVAKYDFNDDGHSDILLRNPSTGENYLYPMNGTSVLATEGYIRTVAAPWDIVGLGDFDGNGTADILLRNSSTGENYVYFMDGATITSEGYIRTVPLAWSVAGVADLDGDGKADILLRNTSTGENYLYPMDGLSIKGTEGFIRIVSSPWTIAGLADFDGDGKADILLRNTSTGENYLYPMEGTTIKGTEGYIRTVPLVWDIAGLGDFDGDGKADILLRNSGNGDNYLYPMDGTSIKPTEGYIRTVALVWAVASIADFDGDGKVDILLRNTSTGENYLYPMEGTNIKPTEGYVRTVPLVWTVVSK